ncbi:MAG: hypothetical protein CMM26_06130 [Rhodospirillaceae bacterium]|nr:hypothetical protein [Rhodospirillaceae bacterium]
MGPSIELPIADPRMSRVCHDLISPVGAVNSGIELRSELVAAGQREPVARGGTLQVYVDPDMATEITVAGEGAQIGAGERTAPEGSLANGSPAAKTVHA